jgi:hypothetical protein
VLLVDRAGGDPSRDGRPRLHVPHEGAEPAVAPPGHMHRYQRISELK